jgi:hypothetical protein
MVVPAVAVNVAPRAATVPIGSPPGGRRENGAVEVRVELANNAEQGSNGVLTLQLPAGWSSTPPSSRFAFARRGERGSYRFTVSVPALDARDYRIEAVATVGDRQYREGYEVIEHREGGDPSSSRKSPSVVRSLNQSSTACCKRACVVALMPRTSS